MLGMPSQIELYEEMSLLSSRMVRAARAGEWGELIRLETRVSELRGALQAVPEDGGSPTDLERKRQLVQGILEDDAEVRRHTEPWMEHVRRFLGDSSRRRDVDKAYAAGAGDSVPGGLGA